MLPDDVWGTILHHADSQSFLTLKKVSKNLRLLVRNAVEVRWEDWRSRAAKVAKMPKERGDELDKRLFYQICMGNDQIIFPALEKKRARLAACAVSPLLCFVHHG